MFDKLFSPIVIRGLTLENRIVFPPMGTKFSGKDSYVTDQLIEYHLARVKGGSKFNMVEVSSVHTPSAPKGFLSISDDKYIPGLKKLVDSIHKEGAKCGIQLWQGSICVTSDRNAKVLVPSDMPVSPSVTIKGMSVEEIQEVIKCYGEAAKRAKKAGFDCVEFHCAHNYLPHSFLSGAFNHRDDDWGGSNLLRARFPLECIKEIRKNIPSDMPLFMRIDAQDDYVQGGMSIDDTIEFCKWAKDAGVDVLDVSRGNVISAANKYEVPPIDIKPGFNIDNAAKIRRETGLITIGVGRLNKPDIAEKALEDDKVDLVVMGRAQLADPNFINKVKNGQLDDIDYCVGCDQGCLDGFADANTPFITCLRNPALGREKQCQITKCKKPQTVLVAGGGIAGLEAAIILKQRGHKPILCEQSNRIGGSFFLAGVAPRKKEMQDAVLAMEKKAEKLGVDIRLNTKVDVDLVKQIRPDYIFNCIGAEPLVLNLPDTDLDDFDNVLYANEVLDDFPISGDVVVIGGGMVGLEVAEYAKANDCNVTVLEMRDEIGTDLGMARKSCVLEELAKSNIKVVTSTKVTGISAYGRSMIVKAVDKDNKESNFPCQYAIIAIGYQSRTCAQLQKASKDVKAGYVVIGDAKKARRAIDATREAFDAAMTFDSK